MEEELWERKFIRHDALLCPYMRKSLAGCQLKHDHAWFCWSFIQTVKIGGKSFPFIELPVNNLENLESPLIE